MAMSTPLERELAQRGRELNGLSARTLVELVIEAEMDRDVARDDRENLRAKVDELTAEVDRHVVELNAWDEWASHLPSDIDLGGAVS